jgi:Dehydrogenases with different specificities (related to short-chain alcohol dehydrogenases)
MDKLFAGKVALVTGGRSGIGKATAIAFASHGANVVIADWIEDEHRHTLKAVQSMGVEALFIKCNVSEKDDVAAMIDKTITHFGRLDFAFNNAGIEGQMGAVHECTEANWDKVMDINLKGVWLCMKYELLHMRSHERGVIVNCSSVAGLKGFVHLPAYVASKHGVIGLTKTAALENAVLGIRINAVCPGVIRTPMIERVTENDLELEEQYRKMEPIGRMGLPEEVASAVVWLCSDEASFITGDAIPVDGGITA